MKQYLIILLIMVACAEKRICAMDDRIGINPVWFLQLIAELKEEYQQQLQLQAQPTEEQRQQLQQRRQQEQQRQEEQRQQEWWQQWRAEQQRYADQQRREEREEQRQRRKNMLERQAEAINRQNKIYNNNHFRQIRGSQYNAPIHQPRSNNYAAKNRRS